jgi:choline kinase
MKALITAAGLGSRMGKLTNITNKCVLEVNKIPIIVHLVNNLNLFGINDIYVIVGYKSDKIIDLLKNRVKYLYNNDFETTGILDSIYITEQMLSGQEFVVMTGDSVMHPDILKNIINENGDIIVSVDKKKCDEEDVKVIISNSRFIKISKNINPSDAIGEFTALVKISSKVSKLFFDLIERKNQGDKLLADIIMRISNLGYDVKPIYTKGLPRIEIDFESDLIEANNIFYQK